MPLSPWTSTVASDLTTLPSSLTTSRTAGASPTISVNGCVNVVGGIVAGCARSTARGGDRDEVLDAREVGLAERGRHRGERGRFGGADALGDRGLDIAEVAGAAARSTYTMPVTPDAPRTGARDDRHAGVTALDDHAALLRPRVDRDLAQRAGARACRMSAQRRAGRVRHALVPTAVGGRQPELEPPPAAEQIAREDHLGQRVEGQSHQRPTIADLPSTSIARVRLRRAVFSDELCEVRAQRSLRERPEHGRRIRVDLGNELSQVGRRAVARCERCDDPVLPHRAMRDVLAQLGRAVRDRRAVRGQ